MKEKDSFTYEEVLAGPYPTPWMLEDPMIAANLEKNPDLCKLLNFLVKESVLQSPPPSPDAKMVPFLQNTKHFRKALREWSDQDKGI